MGKKEFRVSLVLFSILMLGLAYELFRDTFFKTGDFTGYALVGNLVMDGEFIYNQPKINTWPPFFSLVCVPIAILDNFNYYFVRFIWLLGSTIALYYTLSITVQLAFNRKLTIFPLNRENILTENSVSVLHWAIMVPFIIIFKYILDNLSNIQINIFMMLMALGTIYFFNKKRPGIAALILAFSISLKVYTIFLLLYFVIKREFRLVGYSLIFLTIFTVLPILVYGYEQTIEYYSFWYEHNIAVFADVGHKNQSYFSLIRRLFMHESPGMSGPLQQEIYINLFDLSLDRVKKLSYLILAPIGLYVVYLFREKLVKRNGLKAFLEYALILNAIPLLSPLAWKAYFIFLWPSFIMNYIFIFHFKNHLKKTTHLLLKTNFFLGIILTIFSSEVFVGVYFSDILEVYSTIAIGAIIIGLNLILIYKNYSKFKPSELVQTAKN